MSDHQALAVIIGRAGSKGLPGKNAMMIAGAPMIVHTIRHAQAARCVDRILVSTDGETIAEAARAAFGSRLSALGTNMHGRQPTADSRQPEIIMRPPNLAGDTATVDAAVRHAIEQSGAPHEIIIILYANVPVRPADLIDRAVDTLVETGADSVQSYADVGKHHPWWMVRIEDSCQLPVDSGQNGISCGRVVPHHPNTVYRRQDLPPLFLPDGGVIAVRRENLFTVIEDRPHAFLGEDRRGVVNAPGAVVDVDTPLDFAVAEAMLRAR